MKSFGILLLTVFALFVGSPVDQFANAQEKLDDKDRATIYFEADLTKLMNSKYVREIGLDTILEPMSMDKDSMGFSPRSATRVVGALRLPNEPAQMMAFEMGNDDAPLSGIWHIEFSDNTGPSALEEGLIQYSETIEIDGKTFYSQGGGMLIHITDKTLSVGTKDYLLNSDQDLTTPRLRAALDQLPPNQAVKFGIDVQGSKKFIEGLFEMEEEDLWMFLPEPSILPMLNFYKDLDEVVISGDLDQEQILTLIANSPDENAAKKINATVSQLFNMAKLGGKMGMAELDFLKKEDVESLTALLDQLNLSQDGKVNSAKVVTPDGFSKMVANLSAEMRRQAAIAQKQNNYRQAGIAIHNFHDAYGKLPFGDLNDEQWHKDLSWRARVCQYFWDIDESLAFSFDEPWDSDANQNFADKMPKPFGADGKNSTICWIKSNVTNFNEITDGSSNTVMLIENPTPIPWTQPKDLSVLSAIKMVKGLEDGKELVVVMYDSSVQKLDNSFTHNELKSLFTPGGNEEPVRLWDRNRRGPVKERAELIIE